MTKSLLVTHLKLTKPYLIKKLKVYNMLKVEILYFTGCPNFRRSCNVVCGVLEKQNVEFELSIRPVKDETLSLNPSFIGSPTVLINGIDVERCYNKKILLEEKTSEFVDGLACRLYSCDISKECPSEEMIVCALNS